MSKKTGDLAGRVTARIVASGCPAGMDTGEEKIAEAVRHLLEAMSRDPDDVVAAAFRHTVALIVDWLEDKDEPR